MKKLPVAWYRCNKSRGCPATTCPHRKNHTLDFCKDFDMCGWDVAQMCRPISSPKPKPRKASELFDGRRALEIAVARVPASKPAKVRRAKDICPHAARLIHSGKIICAHDGKPCTGKRKACENDKG
jgi:hypothetical protein